MLDRGPLAHVPADLADNRQGRVLVDALDHRQIDAAETIQGVADIEVGMRLVLARAAAAGGWQLVAAALVRKGLQVPLDGRVAGTQLVLVKLVQVEGLTQREQMLLPPVAVQRRAISASVR